MKFTPGIAITEARGSFQSTTFSKNAAGAIIRSKVKPINRRTTKQSLVRQQFGSIASSWRGLTQVQRNSWEAAKSSFPYQDSLGQTKIYTASQLYEKFNRNLLVIGESLITDAPAPTSFEIYSLTIGADGTDDLSIAFTPTPVPADDTVVIYATRPLSPGIGAAGNSDFRLITTIAPAGTSPLVLVTAYEAVFGSLAGAVGQKVFIQIKPVKTASGIAATPLRTFAILTAP
jgi:hypothetical protein